MLPLDPTRRPGCHYPFPQDLRWGPLPDGWSGLGALGRRLALVRSAACYSRRDGRPPRPRAGGRSRLGVGQPWVPLPVLAAIETAPALGSRRLFWGSQRREVCSEGHWWDGVEAQVSLQSFHIRLSLPPRAGPASKPSLEAVQTPAVC